MAALLGQVLLVFERDHHLGTELGNLVVLEAHVNLDDLGDPDVLQALGRHLDRRPRGCLPGLGTRPDELDDFVDSVIHLAPPHYDDYGRGKSIPRHLHNHTSPLAGGGPPKRPLWMPRLGPKVVTSSVGRGVRRKWDDQSPDITRFGQHASRRRRSSLIRNWRAVSCSVFAGRNGVDDTKRAEFVESVPPAAGEPGFAQHLGDLAAGMKALLASSPDKEGSLP